jgi:cyclophilin family peptidyl-prolyl cis-trans isomerase
MTRRALPRLAAVLGAALFVAGCSGEASPTPIGNPDPSSSAPPSARSSACPTSGPSPMPAGDTATVTIETAKGTIVLGVEADLGPLAAANFVALARCGFYDGAVFHRIDPDFVIQGGDPTGTGSGGPGYQFANDVVSVAYTRGIVAMANAGRDTNGSQFFIVLADAALPPDYSVFARVTSGMEVADAIATGERTGMRNDIAANPVAMDRVTVKTP